MFIWKLSKVSQRKLQKCSQSFKNVHKTSKLFKANIHCLNVKLFTATSKLHHIACIFHSQCFPADFSQQVFISVQTASSETRKLLSFQQLLFSYTKGKLKGFEHVLNYLTKLQLKTMSETERIFLLNFSRLCRASHVQIFILHPLMWSRD